MSDYPECEKMKDVSDLSQAIGEFIDWLPSQGLCVAEKITRKLCPGGGLFAKWTCAGGRKINDRTEDDEGECPVCEGSGEVDRNEPYWLPAGINIEQLLAKHFEIDLTKVDDERRSMLAAMRAS